MSHHPEITPTPACSAAPTALGRRTLRPSLLFALLSPLLLALLSLAGRPTPAVAASWVPETSNTGEILYDVDCLSTTFCKAVGSRGTILSFDGTVWRAEESPTTAWLYGIDCVYVNAPPPQARVGPPTTVVGYPFCTAVGQRGTILSYNGTTWAAQSGAPNTPLWDVSCVSLEFCRAVGEDGTIVSFDGESRGWGRTIEDRSDTRQSLKGVACTSTTWCKAVGSDGMILAWNGPGDGWTTESSSPTTRNLNGIDCLSTAFCRAVGSGGTVLSYDGTAWGVIRDPPWGPVDLWAVACASGALPACKAVGTNGAILDYDGYVWTPDNPGAQEIRVLNGVACVSPDFCKAVGTPGIILSLR